MFRLLLPALCFAACLGTASPASAQLHVGLLRTLLTPFPTSGAMPDQVFSANPVGLAYDFYNFEYEMRTNDSVTVGAGASRFGGRRPYMNGDVFFRYYPSGRAFNGLTLGVKAGMTQFRGGDRYPGVGIDINQSSTVNEHIVMSAGLGLKRLVRTTPGIDVIPTFRFNIGIGF